MVRASMGHRMDVYDREAAYADVVAKFIGSGIRHGELCVQIATPVHRAAVRRRLLAARLIGPAARGARGSYVAVDAARTLARFMVEGRPDRRRFRAVIDGLVGPMRARPDQHVRLYGEMVSLLFARGELKATIALEGLWNNLLRSRGYALQCSYRLQDLRAGGRAASIATICAAHVGVSLPLGGPGARSALRGRHT